jgi:1,4-alpha-glucan branching enzyme
VGNRGGVEAEPIEWMGRPYSIPMALPPLAGVVMVLESAAESALEEPDSGTETEESPGTLGSSGTDSAPATQSPDAGNAA